MADADSGGRTGLICPTCGTTVIRRHSGCLAPILLGIGLIALQVIVPIGAKVDHALAVIVALLTTLLVIAAIARGFSALFGNHKCKNGHRWR